MCYCLQSKFDCFKTTALPVSQHGRASPVTSQSLRHTALGPQPPGGTSLEEYTCPCKYVRIPQGRSGKQEELPLQDL